MGDLANASLYTALADILGRYSYRRISIVSIKLLILRILKITIIIAGGHDLREYIELFNAHILFIVRPNL